ncbi:MAG TPA: hypothetical protein VHP33_31860 [Polyangiaceae bacterium]|nr:hypothetical protein [Polyangiaceae bacterium]
MGYRAFTSLLLLGALGCGAAEGGESLDESQQALDLWSNGILRMYDGKCVYPNNGNGWKTIDCPLTVPSARRFDLVSKANGRFLVRDNSNQCIAWQGNNVTARLIPNCTEAAGNDAQWKVWPGSGDLSTHYQLQNMADSTQCLTQVAAPGAYMKLSTCTTAWPAQGTQILFMDNW